MYFCRENSRLFMYEKLMQQTPEYRPRGKGLYVSHRKTLLDKVLQEVSREQMILRMLAYDLPERLQREIVAKQRRHFYMNDDHRRYFLRLLEGHRGKIMKRNSRYLAAVFLLSSDRKLWKRVKHEVTDQGILFESIFIKGFTEDQYTLFFMAKDIYTGERFVQDEELADPEIVSDELYSLIVNAFLLAAGGIELLNFMEGTINE